MGWSSGTYVMEDIIMLFERNVPDHEIRKTLYKGIIGIFEDSD